MINKRILFNCISLMSFVTSIWAEYYNPFQYYHFCTACIDEEKRHLQVQCPLTVAMITSKEWEICQVLDATKSTWWAFLILFQELNVAMVIKEFNILMLKRPLNQERYKILLMIYFLIYRNLLEFIIFVQSYFHYL